MDPLIVRWFFHFILGRLENMNHPLISITESGCWEWQGARDAAGYGQLGINRQHHAAHRLWYIVHVGPIPAGKMILHSCDNPPCVNPAHLRPGTALDNFVDMVDRKRRHETPTKLSLDDELAICHALKSASRGDRARIARAYDVDPATITAIAKRHDPSLVERRLTDAERAEIVAASTGERGEQLALAKQYGVSPSSISALLRRARVRP